MTLFPPFLPQVCGICGMSLVLISVFGGSWWWYRLRVAMRSSRIKIFGGAIDQTSSEPTLIGAGIYRKPWGITSLNMALVVAWMKTSWVSADCKPCIHSWELWLHEEPLGTWFVFVHLFLRQGLSVSQELMILLPQISEYIHFLFSSCICSSFPLLPSFLSPTSLRQCLTVPQASLKLLLCLSFPSAEVLGIAATTSLTKQAFYLFSFFLLLFPCGIYWSDLAPLDWPSDCFHNFIFLFKYILPFLALHWIKKIVKFTFWLLRQSLTM